MRSFLFAAGLTSLLALPAVAQPPQERREGDRPRDRQEQRENLKKRLLNAFDTDGDGKLSEEERRQISGEAREHLRRLMGGEQDRQAKDRDARGGAEGRRDKPVRYGDGKKRGRPPKHPRDRAAMEELRELITDALFQRFDADNDGQLSRQEFRKLAQFVQRLHAARRPGGPGFRGDQHPPHQRERLGPPGRSFGGPPGKGPDWRERGDRPREEQGIRRPRRPDRPNPSPRGRSEDRGDKDAV